MMSFLLISVAVPNSTLALGIGTMVGWLFAEKAYLQSMKRTEVELFFVVYKIKTSYCLKVVV